jgi:integrase
MSAWMRSARKYTVKNASMRESKHPDFVFVQEFKNKEPQPVRGMNNTAWKNARERAAEKWSEAHLEPAPEGFRRVRVHDLKHTFGRRLRAGGRLL